MSLPCKYVFAVSVLFAPPLAAQVSSQGPALPAPALQQTLTTGIVGFTSDQTVQLNVLNISTATTATVAGCDVELAFYDAQNHVLKQGTTANITPGTAASLSLGRGDVPASGATAPRVSVRGQVKTVPPPTPTAGASGTPILLGGCSLLASLEIYDNVTGVTQVFTTDARTVFTGEVVPLMGSKAVQ